jgi:hypothetical protein
MELLAQEREHGCDGECARDGDPGEQPLACHDRDWEVMLATDQKRWKDDLRFHGVDQFSGS